MVLLVCKALKILLIKDCFVIYALHIVTNSYYISIMHLQLSWKKDLFNNRLNTKINTLLINSDCGLVFFSCLES